MAFIATTQSMVIPLVPLFSLTLGASPILVGALVSSAFVLPLLLSVPIGALMGLWRSRKIMTVGTVGLCLAPLSVAVLPNIAVLALVQIAVGLFHLILIVAFQTFVASLGAGKTRELNVGWYATFVSLGQLAGPLLAGLIVDYSGYQLAFTVAGAMSLAAVVLSRFLSSREAALEKGVVGPTKGLRRVGVLMKNQGVKMAMVTSGVTLFALGIHQAFLPVYLDQLAYPATAIGLLISLRALASMMVRPFMPRIINAISSRSRALLVMVLVIAVGLGLIGFVKTIAPLVLISILIGVGSGISQPLSIVALVDHVQSGERGLAIGMRLTGNYLALLVGPLLLGIVVEITGFGMAFLASALVLGLFSLLILRWGVAFDEAEKGLTLSS